MTTTPIMLLLILISILVFKGMKNGSIKFTGKRFLLGLIITIVVINVTMFFIL
jgi:hypothetical protein